MKNFVLQFCVFAVAGWINRGQGLGNQLLTPLPGNSNAGGSIQCRERLGGTLNFYYRAAP